MARRRLIPYLFVAPAIVVLSVVVLFPLLNSVRLGLTSWSLTNFNSPGFIGLDNYARMLRDKRFLASLVRTLLFAGGTVALQFLIGFGMALVFAGIVRGRKLVNTLVLLPIMIPSVVAAVMWLLILEPQFGLLNAVLRLLGAPGNTAWLSSISTALGSMIVIETWRGVPFVALILTAGIASLPPEPYEAASIDGASHFQTLRYLTVPLLSPLIMLVLALRIIDALRSFDTFYVLTRGGPADATAIASIFLYRQSFESYQLGYSSVLGQALLLTIAAVSALVFLVPRWLTRR